jgi:hypothetical protein
MLSAAAAPAGRQTTRAQLVVVRGLEAFVFAGLPLICCAFFAHLLIGTRALFDFRTFWESGRAVMHGLTPYPSALPTVAHANSFRPFVYPAPAAFAMVPFAVLPIGVAETLWVVASVAAVVGTLWLLGVRDWRCYGIVFVWPSIWSALVNGSATLILAFACAALWRSRSRPYIAGALVALLIVFKLYLWPLMVWLLATRRVRASIVAFAATAGATLGCWAMIGFEGLREYPRLLSHLTSLVAGESYSPYALLRSLGLASGDTQLAVLFLVAPLIAAVVVSSHLARGDATAFVLAIGASLALTPIVWPHYWALLLVVVALAASELDAVWLLPLAGWVVSTAWSGGSTMSIGLALAVYGLTIAWSVRRLACGGRPAAFRPSVLRPAVK